MITEQENEVIDETNFDEHFFDVRQHKPERGQIIAQYCASAEFVDGGEKRQIIHLLRATDKMVATSQVMRKLLFASERDSYRVPRMMAEDMAGGMSDDDCAAKVYKYTIEMHFYTKSECVPKDDPHWSIISVLNLDEFLDKKDEQIKSRILKSDEVEQPSLDRSNDDCDETTQDSSDAGASELRDKETD